jgi:plasminogen activator inhibitor 1 RNA-binding protein
MIQFMVGNPPLISEHFQACQRSSQTNPFFFGFPGNDPELDPSRPAPPPARAVDRPIPRVGKRDAPKDAPAGASSTAPRTENNRRGGRVTAGNEAGM